MLHGDGDEFRLSFSLRESPSFMFSRLTFIILFTLPLLGVVFGLVAWPLCELAYAGMHVVGANGGSFTWARYHSVIADSYYRESLYHSLSLSALVAMGGTLLSLPPAWLLARHDFPGKRFLRTCFTLPMSLSGMMVGFLAVVMLGRVGVVPQLFQAAFGVDWLSGTAYQLTGLVIAYLYFEIPRGVLSLEAPLRKLDPRWEAAARSLGAGPWRRWWSITLPLIAPSLLTTFTLTFSVSLGSFGAALILSRRFSVLPLELFHEFSAMSNAPMAAAMGIVLALCAWPVHLLAGLIGTWEERRA